MIFAAAAPLKTNYIKIKMPVFIIIVELLQSQNGLNSVHIRCTRSMFIRAAQEEEELET
jgi:hypothetical protein